MVQSKWCPSDVALVAAQFTAPTLYYVSRMRRSSTRRDHSRCTDKKCKAFRVDPAVYRTKHVEPGCARHFTGPPEPQVMRIIRSGKIPILSLKENQQGDIIEVSVEPYRAGVEYVAVSHVWADDLGNVDENKLPQCQLRHIKRILDDLVNKSTFWRLANNGRLNTMLRRSRSKSIRFWIDTICVPLRQIDSEARDRAINQMNDTYVNAYQVLVLDAELQSLDALDMTEAFMQISLSGWMRRLWTLNEGVLARRLHVKFKNDIFDLREMNDSLNPRSTTLRESIQVIWGTILADASQFY